MRIDGLLRWRLSARHASEWRGVVLLTGLAGGLLSWAAAPLSAQISYTIFPAAATAQPDPQGSGRQPTGRVTTGPVTLSVQDSTIGYAVDAVAEQAHLRPVFNTTSPVIARRVTVHITSTSVMDAFAVVLKGTGLVARVAPDGETVVISAGDLSSGRSRMMTAGTIVGRVTDSASGQGLGGASVKVDGTKLSTVTSDSGHFTLRNVPSGDQVLSVRLFGYRPAERTVTVEDSEQTRVSIVMVPVPTVLSGVVTTATGLQRKVEVGNDITSLNVDSIMKVAPITSVTDLLETRVPGLTVLHTSGAPGDPSRLRLRGAGSVYMNNDPIVIVDGVRVYASQSDPRNDNLAPSVLTFPNARNDGSNTYAAPSPLDQIDPNSIETVEVMKGPSATAIYGSDAASGVIIITTKHGRAGPAHWDLNLAEGVSWLPGQWPSNYYKFGLDSLNPSLILCSWADPFCQVDSVVAYQALNVPSMTVLSHGSNQQASLSVSGGVPSLTYSLSGTGTGDFGNLKLPAFDQQRYEEAYGQIPGDLVRPDRYTTYGGSGSLTALPSPTMRISMTSSMFSSNQQRGSLQDAITQLEGTYHPGQINDFVLKVTDNQLSSTNALSMFWQLRSWLPLTATGGLNSVTRTDQAYIPYGVASAGPGCSGVGCGDTTGEYGLGRGASHDQSLTVGTVIPLFRQRMALAVGGNTNSETTADFSAYTNALSPGVSAPTSFSTTVVDGVSPSTFGQSTTGQSTYGWYVEPRLNFASKFFVSPGFRMDGGSGGTRTTTSGGLGGLSAFPKIDLSYVMVDQSHPLGPLTILRPRLAFGVAGTQPGPADKLRLFNVGRYALTLPGSGSSLLAEGSSGSCMTPYPPLNGEAAYVPAVCLNSLGNTQLQPERSTELEGGFDAELWRGRIGMTFTEYDKTRYNAILGLPVAPSVFSVGGGSLTIAKNIGVIRNTGTEVTLNVNVIQSKAVDLHVGANLSNDNSDVVRLNTGQGSFCINVACVVPGYPLFGIWAKPIVAFADANHDGVIEYNEVKVGDSAVFVGQPSPKFETNANVDASFWNGRVSVHATFAYTNGLTQDDQGACNSGMVALIPNAPNSSLATQAAMVAAGCGATTTPNGVAVLSTPYGLLQTVNTVRFQNLSINCTMPRRVAEWFKGSRVTVSLAGTNLGLHSNYRGIDPNVNAFSTVSGGDETMDTGQLPEPRTWWLRMTVGD